MVNFIGYFLTIAVCSSAGIGHFDGRSEGGTTNAAAVYYYGSSDFISRKSSPRFKEEDEASRYVVYPFDESSSFQDAESISLSVTYDRVFNDRGDSDFYFLSGAGQTVPRFFQLDINESANAFLYAYKTMPSSSTSLFLMMSFQAVADSDIFMLEPNTNYVIKITESANYTGLYSFSLNPIYLSNLENYYVKASYSQAGAFSRFEIVNLDYSSKPSTASRQPSKPAGTLFSIMGTEKASDQQYVYFPTNIGLNTGIFDSNGAKSNLIVDDDRKYTEGGTWPSTAVALTSFYTYNVARHRIGTSFFVDEGIVMTAGHMFFSPIEKEFASDYAIIPNHLGGSIPDSPSHGKYTGATGFCPLSFVVDSLTGVTNHEDDWAVIALNCVSSPSASFSHGFLGLQYGSSIPDLVYLYGYPHCYADIQDQEYLTSRINRCLCSGGTISNYYGTYKTYIDLSPGNSGGPCLRFDDGNGAYVIGLTSGANEGYLSNSLAKINKRNFSIVDDLAEGLI